MKSDHYDIGGNLLYSRKNKRVIGIEHNVGEGYLFWDSEYDALMRGIAKALPDTTNRIVSFSEDERKVIVLSTSDVESGTYFLLDRDKGAAQPIALRYRELAPELMSPKETVKYAARDGLTIEAFLTLPKIVEKPTNLPTIILPHGGPIHADTSSFDYWTQFFANRGYAVLQMNFRGSSGYGFDFMAAGLQNWGEHMQDDITDGLQWLIKKGIADPKKVCIVGASYGGYAALMGSIKTPELYQCAISFGGVSDLEYLVKSSRRYTNHETVEKMVGDDYKLLRSKSPMDLHEKIQIPVLLLHGEDDRVVDVRHSRNLARRLKKYEKNVRYVEFEEGDHYLSNNQHRVKAFTEMDTFLREHLE